jgi:hypothetical protein
VTDWTNHDERYSFIYIIENAIFASVQFPHRLKVFPGWNQARQGLPIFRPFSRFVFELFFQSVQDVFALVGAQVC